MRAEQFLYVNYVLQYVNGHAAVVCVKHSLTLDECFKTRHKNCDLCLQNLVKILGIITAIQ